jgi:flagellar biosynthesis protein FlhF
MILKKFYGEDIKEAREKATEKLGEEYIILESKQTTDEQEARVTVMVDQQKKSKSSTSKNDNSEQGNTYSRKDLFPKSLDKVKEAVTEGFNQFSSEIGRPTSQQDNTDAPKSDPDDEKPLTMSRRSTPVHNTAKPSNQENPDFDKKLSRNLKEKPVSKEVKALHRRFDHMEKLLSDALVSANVQYVSHPAFQQLLNAGMQATTISQWFEQILSKGIDPYEQNQSFMFELAKIVRSALSVALPEAPEKNLLFVGPSGSGKTSLIMKLATNPEFMRDNKVALVSVEPQSNFKQYSRLQLFAEDLELPYFTVTDGVDMSTLLPDLQPFDHVLFDSPSISLQQQAAFREFWKVRQLLGSVSPLEIHYTVNATLEQYYFKESYAIDHPLQPDYVAITHLDETNQWGHLIPFVNGIGAGVRYVSQGPNVPDNIHRFEAEWFAEKILSE